METIQYGTLHRNTLSQKIEGLDTLGATRERKSNGSVFVFNEAKVNELRKIYESEGQDEADLDKSKEKEDFYSLVDGSECSVSSEGYRVCGFVYEEGIQE